MNLIDRSILSFLKFLGLFRIIISHSQLINLLEELVKELFDRLKKENVTEIVLIGIEESGLEVYKYFKGINFSEHGIKVITHGTISIKSYGFGVTSGTATVKKPLSEKIISIIRRNKSKKNFAMVFLDDMSETGGTFRKTADMISEVFGQEHNLKLFYCFMTNKISNQEKVFVSKNEIFAIEIVTNLFLTGFGSDFHERCRKLGFVFGIPKWFYNFLGSCEPLKQYFITLIERYDNDERILC